MRAVARFFSVEVAAEPAVIRRETCQVREFRALYLKARDTWCKQCTSKSCKAPGGDEVFAQTRGPVGMGLLVVGTGFEMLNIEGGLALDLRVGSSM